MTNADFEFNSAGDALPIRQHASESPHCKLARFATYRDGWSFGEGVRFSDVVIEDARSLLDEGDARLLFPRDVFPGCDGEITVCFYSGYNSYEFQVFGKNRIVFSVERNDVVGPITEFTMNKARAKIAAISKLIWNSRESSTPTTTKSKSVVSAANLSSPKAMAFLSSASNAPSRTRVVSANMSLYITELCPV